MDSFPNAPVMICFNDDQESCGCLKPNQAMKYSREPIKLRGVEALTEGFVKTEWAEPIETRRYRGANSRALLPSVVCFWAICQLIELQNKQGTLMATIAGFFSTFLFADAADGAIQVISRSLERASQCESCFSGVVTRERAMSSSRYRQCVDTAG